MARPTKNDIDSGIQGWDGPMDDNDEALFNGPLPIHEHTGDETDLASTFPANSYDRCSVMVDHSTLGWSLYVSDGTSWLRKLRLTTPSVVALTDNTSGTANDTLVALSDPADTPASADALRDDLVANLIPELRDNLADLAAKVNEVRGVMSDNGMLS